MKVQRSSILSEQIHRSAVNFKVQGCPSHRAQSLWTPTNVRLITQRAQERLYVCVRERGPSRAQRSDQCICNIKDLVPNTFPLLFSIAITILSFILLIQQHWYTERLCGVQPPVCVCVCNCVLLCLVTRPDWLFNNRSPTGSNEATVLSSSNLKHSKFPHETQSE